MIFRSKTAAQNTATLEATLNARIGELERQLARVEESSRRKSEFFANLTHELRTPLNAIVNVPGALAKDYEKHRVWMCGGCGATFEATPQSKPDDEESRAPCPECNAIGLGLVEKMFFIGDFDEHYRFLDRLEHSGRHLLRLVNDLLDLSKLEAGRMQLQKTTVSLTSLFADLRATLDSLADKASVTLTYPNVDGFELHADPLKLSQVLVNLVGNALKFTPASGRVQVMVEPVTHDSKRCFRFCVKDSGIGIPENMLEAVFESYRQVESAPGASKGTGLGLAIARQLVELHGGKIWVESRIGSGSSFIFVLPRDEAGSAPGNQNGASAA